MMNDKISGADVHHFGSGRLRAAVRAQGAELCVLETDTGQSLLWNAGKAWSRHAPVLFPIVGRLPNDTAIFDGRSYRMTQHGFARDCVFRWVECRPDGCTLELSENVDTLKIYPYRFTLRIIYHVEQDAFSVTTQIINPDTDRVLPASLGAHPAFLWPFEQDAKQTDYVLDFEKIEQAPIRRVKDGLLAEERFQTPVHEKRLPLKQELFRDDALIFDDIESRSVLFHRPGHQGLCVSWHGYRELGIWTKPGAPFLCIEPWYGHAAPEGFSGEFSDRPGVLHIPSSAAWEAGWTVRLT